MVDDRTNRTNSPGEQAIQSLRQVLHLAWPVDRKPIFSRLVRAIDEVDKEQSRRRKRQG